MLELTRNPSEADLRWFGRLLPAFVAVLGSLSRWRFGAPIVGDVIWAVGGVVVFVYFLAPSTKRPIFLGWMAAAYPIGWTISHVLLGGIYYLLLCPIGLVLRLMGRDELMLTFDRQAKTYWIPRPTRSDDSRYFHQF